MEDVGLVIIPCTPADPGQVAAAKAEFQAALETSQKESASLGCVGIKGFGPNCRRLFYHGVDLTKNEFITHHCGPYEDAMKDEVIMSMVTNDTQLPPWRVGPGKVLLFKPIDQELSEDTGFFRYFDGSHKQSHAIVEGKEIRVGLNEILAIDGDVIIRWPKAGGGVFMLQGIMKKRSRK